VGLPIEWGQHGRAGARPPHSWGVRLQYLLPSARANLLLPSPPAASGMGSTVGFVLGFFRFGDLLACALSIWFGLHMTSLCHAECKILPERARRLVSTGR